MNLIVLHPHLLYPGGASKYMLEVSNRLADRGVAVTVILTRCARKLADPYKKIKFIEINGPSTGEISFWLTFPFFIWKLKKILDGIPDKVLFPQIFPPVWWTAFYKYVSPKTLAIWMCQEPSAFIHSPLVINSLKQPGKFLAQLLNPLLKIVDRRLVSKIDYIFANSLYGASLIEKIYQRKADLFAYPATNPNIYKPKGRKRNYIFTISRLDKQKNIDILIKAFSRLPPKIKNQYQLLIGGQGNEKARLTELVLELGLENKVKFLGEVIEKDLPLYYAEAKIVIFLGENEPFGLVPVEAMACGTPLVALKSGGVRESVIDGETGVLLDSKDEKKLAVTVEKLLFDKHFLNNLSRKARRHVLKNFSWDKTADKIYNFFQNQLRR
ncbi:MAG: glycosyltransferase family 4 protein [Patescibacteria group bacterium]